jgi:hypothetical protein
MAAQPPQLLALFVAAMLVAIVVTPALSLVVLWRYRRAVDRSMRTTAQGRHIVSPPVAVGTPGRRQHLARPTPVVMLDGARSRIEPAGAGDDLWRRSRRRLRATVAVYVVAGLTFGLFSAGVCLAAWDLGVGPRNLIGLAVLFVWPLVPTVLAVVAAARLARLSAWVGYAVLLLLLTVGTGTPLAQTGSVAVVFVVPPALALVALSGRAVRTVGPFLAVPVLLVVAGLLLWPWTVPWVMSLGAERGVAIGLGTLAAVLLGLAGFAHLAWTARQYARKRAGDQMLMISQWWFLAATWQAVVLVPSGIPWALAAWAAYVAFRVVLAVGMRLRPRPTGPPRRLLLLRTFGAPRRSETLLRRLGAHWRHVGTVSMIAGTDLASAVLEPHEFLDLLRGRLARRFVGNPYELRGRVAELDDEPDPDGRYRVGELFCHDDMWRPALLELLRRTDCILIDARGFTRRHEGVAHEITQLVQLVALDRVLVLVDETTDQYHLRALVDRARLDSTMPDAGGSLRLLRSPAGRVDAATVVAQLGRSA